MYLYEEAGAAILEAMNCSVPATAILCVRSLLHRPRLVVILLQASCLDADPLLTGFARALPACPSENKKAGLPGDFCNSSSAKIPSRYNFFAPASSAPETRRRRRFDLTSGELRTRVVLDRLPAFCRSRDCFRRTQSLSQFFRPHAGRKARVEYE